MRVDRCPARTEGQPDRPRTRGVCGNQVRELTTPGSSETQSFTASVVLRDGDRGFADVDVNDLGAEETKQVGSRPPTATTSLAAQT